MSTSDSSQRPTKEELSRWPWYDPLSVLPWVSMKEYIVYVVEVYTQAVRVSADNPTHARERVWKGVGLYLENCLEYHHTEDIGLWTVEEA